MRTSLRSRFLAALAAGSALAGAGVAGGACGGAVETTAAGSGTSGTPAVGVGSSGASGSSGETSTPPSEPSRQPIPPSPPPPTKPDASATCPSGKAEQQCYTHAELEAQWHSPGPWGGDAPSDAGPPPWDPNGCLPAEHVKDGCCNVAISGPVVGSGGTCCYVHCTGACCGRPFIVDGQARVAAVVERDDWCSTRGGPAHALAVEKLAPAVRYQLARAWTNDASMEHASIAAFARFTLDLLAVGAPGDLLFEAQAAMKDEIEHARACFMMASRYAGRALGPGSLDIGGEDGARSLADIAAATVTEGCIGETLSSVLADERARGAAHPFTRALLSRIAEDEARHAELAWRFVGWAIAVGGEPVRAAVARALDASFRRPPTSFDASLSGVDAALLRAHGLLDEAAAREAAARALREVVAPCAASAIAPRLAA